MTLAQRNKPKSVAGRFEFFRHPWFLFWLFSAVNAILAYGALSPEGELWFGLLGLGLPLLAICRYGFPKNISDPLQEKQSSRLHPWAWAGLSLAAAATRFVEVPGFLRFPLHDEIINAYYAIHLASHWTWYPFFYWSQLPPLYIWGLAVLVKIFGFSPFILFTDPPGTSSRCR